MELSEDTQREQIALWIDRGATLATVEDELIEPATVSEDERAAMWLYAWSYAQRRRQSPRPVELRA
jgi:hypothetical protein